MIWIARKGRRPYPNSSSSTRIARGGARITSRPAIIPIAAAEPRLEHRVHDHHQPRLLAEALLHDGLDRHVLKREHLRYLGKDARLVGDLEVQVERGHDVLDDLEHRRSSVGVEAGGIIALITSPSTALAVCGPPAPGPDIVISVIASDSTVTALNGPPTDRQRMTRVQEDRVHAHRQPVADPFCGADQLELEPEVARVLEVVGLDVLDPLVADLVEVHRGVEREARDDRHLGGCVAAVDVVGRVGLGVAEPLGLGQRLVERHPGPRHLGEDEVRGPVDDPVDAVDRGARQRLLEHADHRHHARDGALEAQLHVVLAGGVPQLLAVLGEQLLVGGDDMAARPHRPQQVVARRVDPADQLDDQVRAIEDVVERAPAARHHARQLGPKPRDLLDPLGVSGQQRRERRRRRSRGPSSPTRNVRRSLGRHAAARSS